MKETHTPYFLSHRVHGRTVAFPQPNKKTAPGHCVLPTNKDYTKALRTQYEVLSIRMSLNCMITSPLPYFQKNQARKSCQTREASPFKMLFACTTAVLLIIDTKLGRISASAAMSLSLAPQQLLSKLETC
jgi:hypothetical protein